LVQDYGVVKCRSEGIAFHNLENQLHACYDSIELILFKFRMRLAEGRALTTTDCRAAFISIGADPVICVELSRGEASILLFGKNPVPSVGEVKEQHV
jgi:hypothetical protein